MVLVENRRTKKKTIYSTDQAAHKSGRARLVFTVADPGLLQSTPRGNFIDYILFDHAPEEGFPCQDQGPL